MVRRPGHSLVEMVVALTFLGASLAAITAAGVLSTRRTLDAIRLQEATALAAAILDSVAAGTAPVAGERRSPWGLLEWDVRSSESGSSRVGVRLRGPGVTDTLDLVLGGWIPPAPILPAAAR